LNCRQAVIIILNHEYAQRKKIKPVSSHTGNRFSEPFRSDQLIKETRMKHAPFATPSFSARNVPQMSHNNCLRKSPEQAMNSCRSPQRTYLSIVAQAKNATVKTALSASAAPVFLNVRFIRRQVQFRVRMRGL